MQVYNTTITPTVTGIFTIPNGFQGKYMEIIVSDKGGDTIAHMSIGKCDTVWSTVHSFFKDNTGGKTYKNSATNATGELVAVFERSGGVITKVNSAKFNSFNPTDTKFQVTLCNSMYQYNLVIMG